MKFAVIRQAVLALCLMASGAPVQAQPTHNIFFGFDMALAGIAIKWGCGGERAADLAVLKALMDAYPEQAEHAQLADNIEAMLKASERDTALAELTGIELTDAQKAKLCDAALPLELIADIPGNMAPDADSVARQHAAWTNFFRVAQSLE
ncbi:hypothetical protein [Actibacterium sp. XHP0104]|uniref:hypothetical protein n=1 Tax=Actibacterium sp. XHP0104 TaxID=2984335 RepID=UPI0021E995E5|nr:hypothetical protein [Actibacterium sp. XHP0104]MCV2881217.1 hypothetical protein [Actibacterium sp. XHP0104]